VLRRRYAWFAGPYTSLDVQPCAPCGACTWRLCSPFYPSAEFARAVIGRVATTASAPRVSSALLDSSLRNTGAAVVLKEPGGREYESPARGHRRAEPGGHDVVLTLDAELQEIAQRAAGLMAWTHGCRGRGRRDASIR